MLLYKFTVQVGGTNIWSSDWVYAYVSHLVLKDDVCVKIDSMQLHYKATTSRECVSGGGGTLEMGPSNPYVCFCKHKATCPTNALSFATYSDLPIDDGLCCSCREWISFAMGHVWVCHLTSLGGYLCALLLAESKTIIVNDLSCPGNQTRHIT